MRRPRLVPTLATVLLLPVLISLGFWQLHRADVKRALEEAYAQRARAPALDLARVERWDESRLRYRRARVRGRYLAGRQILLDNQVHEGRAGYHVLTPLVPGAGEHCVLVDRGWIPAPGDRSRVPEPGVPAGTVSVRGLLDQAPEPGIRLGTAVTEPVRWPLVVPWVDPAALALHLGCRPAPLVLKLDPDLAGGFVRDWQPVSLQPEKSVSYAVQWFAMAVMLVVIYLALHLRRRNDDEGT